MALEFDYIHILGPTNSFARHHPRIGPLIDAQRDDPNPPACWPRCCGARAELIAEFGTATPFARITLAQSDGARATTLHGFLQKRYATSTI